MTTERSAAGSGNDPAGHSRIPCFSTTGQGPVPAATIAACGRVVSIHSGFWSGWAQRAARPTGPKCWSRLLSGVPPRAFAAHFSTSIRPRLVMLIVVIRSAPASRTGPNASSTTPWSKSP